jgi:hypothetical protein
VATAQLELRIKWDVKKVDQIPKVPSMNILRLLEYGGHNCHPMSRADGQSGELDRSVKHVRSCVSSSAIVKAD